MVSDVFDKEENRKNYIRGMLRTLTKREENVLRLYFGLHGRERSTLEEIGRDFDKTVNTIKKYKNKGIRKMMHPQRSRLLILYWFSVNWNFPCFELVLNDNPNRRIKWVRTERAIRLRRK